MDYEAYKKAYITDPPPEPRYRISGISGVALYFTNFDAAVEYYQKVLGPAAYVEGKGTRGWLIGSDWLTLLHSKSGAPHNMEVILTMETPEEAERLQGAFIEAGGEGPDPSDQIMYEPVRYCPVRDPFGTDILIISLLDDREDRNP